MSMVRLNASFPGLLATGILQVFGANFITVRFLDDEKNTWVFDVNKGEFIQDPAALAYTELGSECPIRQTLTTQLEMFIPHLAEDDCARLEFTSRELQSVLAVPIIRKHKSLGVLMMGWKQSVSHLSAESLTTAKMYAEQFGVLYENHHLENKVKTSSAKLARLRRFYVTLARINEVIVRVKDQKDLFYQVCQIAVQVGGFRSAWIGMVDGRSDRVIPVASFGACPEYTDSLLVSVDGSKKQGQGPTGTAIRENCTDFIMDLHADRRSLPWIEEMIRCGFASSISTPLHHDNQPIGALTLYAGQANVFGQEEIKLVEEMARVISFAVEHLEYEERRAKDQEQIYRLAYYDQLTRLPNRVLLKDWLDHAIASFSVVKQPFAVLLLDLDGFQEVNDSLGHNAGDALLQEVARRLRIAAGFGTQIARFTGDEFVIVLTKAVSEDAVIRVLTDIREAFLQPVVLEERLLRLTCSIGVTFYHGGQESTETLLRDADIAVNVAKSHGKDQFCFFAKSMLEKYEAEKRLREDMEQALAEQQFCLHYQPQVNMKTGKVVGAEALLRWSHPEKGLLMPGMFLPPVQKNPIIKQVGKWVLEEVFRQLQDWLRLGFEMEISANVSPLQFQEPDFLQFLVSLLRRYPEIQASRVKLELLEDATFADNFNLVQSNIEQCHELGFRVSLDDFGTGYSSLTHLQQLDISEVKIDQTFTRKLLDNPRNIAIVSGLMSTALPSNLQIVAEGVEDEDTGQLLLRLGCELAQGYFIARPMPVAQFVDWVNNFSSVSSWRQLEPWRLPIIDLPGACSGLVHKRTVENLIHSLRDVDFFADVESTETRFKTVASSLRHCEFGRWYDTVGKHRYARLPLLHEVVEIHQIVHDLATELVSVYQAGKIQKAKMLAERLTKAMNLFTKQLDSLIHSMEVMFHSIPRI